MHAPPVESTLRAPLNLVETRIGKHGFAESKVKGYKTRKTRMLDERETRIDGDRLKEIFQS